MFVSIDNPPMAKMEQLYHDFHHRLFIYAMTLLNEEDKAKDVVADVFCAVWEDWHRTASNTAGYTTPNATYLFLLTRNKCIDLLRHEKAKRNYASLLEKATPPTSDEDILQYEGRLTRLMETIERLPEPGRSILRCCYFNKLTYQQTADKLQLTLVVVRKNMLKVFKILRKELKNTI